MATIESIQLQLEAETTNANIVMEVTLEALLENGVITHKQAKDFRDSHAVVLLKRSWLKRFFSNDDGWFYKIIRIDKEQE